MSKEEKYFFVPVCSQSSARGLLQVDAKGVIILTTYNIQTGEDVTVCLSTSADETEGFIGAIQHALEHQNKETEKADPEKRVDHFGSGMTFEEVLKNIKKLH